MKRPVIILAIMLVLLASCQKDPDIPIVSLTVSDKVEAEWLTANLSGAATANTKVNDLFVQLSKDESFGVIKEVQTTYNKGQFVAELTNLTPQTTYYYRYRATNKLNAFKDQAIHSFKTKDYAAPTVSTTEVTNVTYTSAVSGGSIVSNGGYEIIEKGICYATTSNPTINNTKIVDSVITSVIFSCPLNDLADGTTYYVRAFANYNNGISYGVVKSFTTTSYSASIVTTSDITNISHTSATCGGNVTDCGGLSITERGICYATTTNPTISDTKVVASDTGTGDFSCNLTGLIDGTTYYVRAYSVNKKGISYGEIKSFSTILITTGTEAGHDWVDLGLSVKWATMNVGATKVEGYGNYYAWGETSTKKDYNWSTYKYCNGSDTTITKYCTSSIYGIVDNKKTLEAADDAAHVNWGGNWRMPTITEIVELKKNCTITWTKDYQGTGIAGRIFTSNKAGYTDKFIFLPAAGVWEDLVRSSVGGCGLYASSSLHTDASCMQWGLYFHSDYVHWFNSNRCFGSSVRAVCP